MHPVIQRLKERKLIQWALAYGAGAWLVLQILDVTAEPWGLSGGVIRTAQASLAVAFIITLVLAWPSTSQWTGVIDHRGHPRHIRAACP